MWTGAFENWAHAWVEREFWRVREYFNNDREDALQECAMLFYKCCHLYGNVVCNASWMMALFKRAVANRWIYLAKRSSEYRLAYEPMTDELWENYAEQQAIEPAHAMLHAAIAEQPGEFHSTLSVILRAPDEVLQFIFSDWRLVNRRLRWLCGTRHMREQLDVIGRIDDLTSSD